MAREGLAVQDNFAAFTDIKPEIDAFVYGKTSHQTVLVIDMRTQGANTIWTENMVFHTLHAVFSIVKQITVMPHGVHQMNLS